MRNNRTKIINKVIVFFAMLVIGLSMANVAVQAADLVLNQENVILYKGKTKKLKALKKPSKKAKVKWKTSNKYAVTVSKNGKLKAKNYGTAIITATCKKKTAQCYVVVPTSSTVIMSEESITLTDGGESRQLSAKVNGKKASVKYYSENTSIAKVDSKGIVTPVNPGSTYVVAYTKKGYGVCYVEVLPTATTTDTTNEIQTSYFDSYYDSYEPTIIISGEYDNSGESLARAVGLNFNLELENVYVGQYADVIWSVDDNSIVSEPIPSESNSLIANVTAIKEGVANVTVKLTDYDGAVTEITKSVYVTNPSMEQSSVILYDETAGSLRAQFVSLAGTSEASNIVWSVSDTSQVSYTSYDHKVSLMGLTPGTGTITATVDGKTLTCSYTVIQVNFKESSAIIEKGKTKKISVKGTGSVKVKYKSRNKKVAKVSSTGKVTAVGTGNTYIDINVGNMNYIYRVEVAAKGMKKIIKRANYIVNNWTYSQAKRMQNKYYDCSALVWKGYKAYKNYHKKLGSSSYALTAAGLFDYLKAKGQIKYYGFTSQLDLQPGDLLFYGDYNNAVLYSTPGRTLDIYHVAMYAGNGMVVEEGGKTLAYNGTRYIVGVGRVVK